MLLVLVTVLVVLEDLAAVQVAVEDPLDRVAVLLNLAHLGSLDLTDTVTAVVLTPIRHLTQVLVAAALVVVVLRVVTLVKHLEATVVPVLLLVRQLLTLVAAVVVEVSHLPLEAATAVLVEEVTVGHLLPTLVTVLDRRAHLDAVAVAAAVQDLPGPQVPLVKAGRVLLLLDM